MTVTNSHPEARTNFQAVPVLDYAKAADPETKQEFLADLRNVLFNVGFMYVKNHPVPESLIASIKDYTVKVFDMPLEKKLEIEMANSPTFLGYNRLGYEVTKNKIDHREQFDFGPDIPERYVQGETPEYYRLRGQAQWPDEKVVPGFKAVVSEYLERMSAWGTEFSGLVEEALELKPGTLSNLYGNWRDKYEQGGWIKMIKYPSVSEATEHEDQGVGPHKDGWMTYLLILDDVPGLQVQNHTGDWLWVPRVEGTYVVNIGFWVENLTHGAAIATTHRVVSPPPGSPPRYSLPFFQSLSLDARVAPLPDEELPEVLREFAKRKVETEADRMQFPFDTMGEALLYNRIRAHPDVGRRQYPKMAEEVFKDFSTPHPAFRKTEVFNL